MMRFFSFRPVTGTRPLRIGYAGPGYAVLFVALGVLQLWLLLQAWDAGPITLPWLKFWSNSVYFAFLAYGLLLVVGSIGGWRARTPFLGYLLHTGDLDLPLVEADIVPLPESETLAQPERFGHLLAVERIDSAPKRTLYALRATFITGFPFFVVILIFGSMQQLFSPYLARFAGALHRTAFDLSTGGSIFIFIMFPLMLIANYLLQNGYPWQSVMATKEGLRVAKRLIPWQSVQGFYVYRVWNATIDKPQPLYWRIETADEILSWQLGYNSSQATVQRCLLLEQIITASSMLPLRDMTSFASDLRAQRNNLPRLIAEHRARVLPTAGIERMLPTSQAKRSWQRVVGALVIVLTLAVVVLGGIAQITQPSYLAALPARVRAHTPIFSDSLAVPTGTWPVGANTVYEAGAYHLRGGQPVFALTNRQYADAVVEVTITSSVGQAGLVVRSDAASRHMLALLFVPYDDGTVGYWSLRRCSPTIDYLDCLILSPSFQFTTLDAPRFSSNRMMIWMHGNAYRFYINDQFVGSYIDAADDIPSQGYVGLCSFYGSKDVAYTNFVVYPVDATLPWDY